MGSTIDFSSWRAKVDNAAARRVGPTVENAVLNEGTKATKTSDTSAIAIPSVWSNPTNFLNNVTPYASLFQQQNKGAKADSLDGLKEYAKQKYQGVEGENNDMQRKIADAKQDKATKTTEKEQATKEKTNAEKDVSKCETNVSNCEAKVNDIKSQLSGLDSVKDASKISQLKQLLEQAKQALEKAKNELQNAKETLKEKTQALTNAEKALESATSKLEMLTNAGEMTAERLKNVGDVKSEIESLKNSDSSIFTGVQFGKNTAKTATSIFSW